MLKKRSKALFAAALLLVLCVFSACSDNSTASKNTSNTSTTGASGAASGTSAGESSTSTEVTQIVWYVGGKGPERPNDVYKALNEMSAKDIGVTVDFKFQTSNDEVARLALASGASDFDICFASSWFADYRNSAQSNYFVDLTELLPEKTPELYEKIPSLLWEGVTVNDKIYGVPTWKDSAATLFWLGRTEILEAAGALDDFNAASLNLSSMTPTLEKIKAWHDADPEKNAYTEGTNAPVMYSQKGEWGINFAWDILNYDLEIGVKDFQKPVVMSMYDDPDYIADLKVLKDWADRGLSNGIAAPQIESVERAVIGRSVGWDGAQYTVWGGDALGFKTTLKTAAGPLLKSDAAVGSVNCIPLNSKHIDEALRYLQYINTNKEYRNMLAYGIEGTNYEVENNKYRNLTGSDYLPPNYTMASFDLLYAPVEVPNDDMYKTICDSVNTAPDNALMGFAADLSGVQNELAACASIVKEYAWPLHCGVVDDVDAYVANYRAKLDSMGYQKIIDALQEQVTEFLASK